MAERNQDKSKTAVKIQVSTTQVQAKLQLRTKVESEARSGTRTEPLRQFTAEFASHRWLSTERVLSLCCCSVANFPPFSWNPSRRIGRARCEAGPWIFELSAFWPFYADA